MNNLRQFSTISVAVFQIVRSTGGRECVRTSNADRNGNLKRLLNSVKRKVYLSNRRRWRSEAVARCCLTSAYYILIACWHDRKHEQQRTEPCY